MILLALHFVCFFLFFFFFFKSCQLSSNIDSRISSKVLIISLGLDHTVGLSALGFVGYFMFYQKCFGVCIKKHKI